MIVAFLAVFTGIWLVTMHVQPENEVEAYKKFLIAKGEKLEISEVLPSPVSPESNGVAVVRSAFALLISASDDWTNLPSTMRMVAPGRAMVGWQQPDVRGYDFTNSWENVMAASAANGPAAELLRQAALFPALDFQLKYNDGAFLMLPHLAPLKHSSQRLSAAAMCALHNGDAVSATTNLCVALALVQEMQAERITISQLVRIAMASIVASASWELLQSTNVTDADLAALQAGWERLEFIRASGNTMLMDRAITEVTIKKLRASRAEFNRMTGLYGSIGMGGSSSSSSWTSSGDWFEDAKDLTKAGWDKTKLAGATFMWRVSWTYSDELHALQGKQLVLESLRTIGTNQFFQPAYSNLDVQLYKLGMTNSSGDLLVDFDDLNLRSMFSGSIGSMSATVRKTMAAETCRRVVITAIALKRFQLKHGTFPEKLSELMPEYVAAVPLDAVDGQPLRYRQNGDGTYLLYSVGEDGLDGGGDLTPAKTTTSSIWNWQRGRDWVWPQPATSAEVQYFYEHPPK